MSDEKTDPGHGIGLEATLGPGHGLRAEGAPLSEGGPPRLSDGEHSPKGSEISDVEAVVVTSLTTETRGSIMAVIRRLWHWKPRLARFDPENPPKFTIWLNILFGFAACFTVSNLYYNQAILNRIAETFGVTFEKASSVATLMQAGYAGGLLLLCPLGDILPRRPFILCLVGFTAAIWLALCLTTSFSTFAAVSFLSGLTTVTPQLLLPLVGDLAPPHRRASALAIVVSGLSLGILVARILGGVLASSSSSSSPSGTGTGTSWRAIYFFGLGAQWLVFLLLYLFLPDYPSKNPHTTPDQPNHNHNHNHNRTFTFWLRTYPSMLLSIPRLLLTEPLLAQAATIAFLLSAVFTSYWTTLSFLLSAPPYSYSSAVVGLFGLIGVVVILAAPVYGRLVIDRFVPLASAVMGLGVEMAGVLAGTFTGGRGYVAGPVVQAVAIDLGSQFTQIANRAAIYGIQPDKRNRVNTAYMVAAFSGQLTGTAVGNRLYAEGGWVYSGSCSIAFVGLALIVCLARGPRETGWVGWSGGWALRRDDLPPKKAESDVEALTEKPQESSPVTGSDDSQADGETKDGKTIEQPRQPPSLSGEES